MGRKSLTERGPRSGAFSPKTFLAGAVVQGTPHDAAHPHLYAQSWLRLYRRQRRGFFRFCHSSCIVLRL